MTETLIFWLAKHFNVRKEQIEKDINYENVAGFLIVWTIFEQKAFEGYITYSKIKTFADKMFHPLQMKLEILQNLFTIDIRIPRSIKI